MSDTISEKIEAAKKSAHSIPEERKETLKLLSDKVSEAIAQKAFCNIIFICTHNSRRSHLSQIWASLAAQHFQLHDKIKNYSGGTEITELNPRVTASLQRFGFEIERSGDLNPHYTISSHLLDPAITCFSKKYDDPANPQTDFIAVMNCSEADTACPFVPGADFRIAVRYEDPKKSDETPDEAATYDLRSLQIATEMFYLFSQVHQQHSPPQI